jgi:hypothetical protein
MVGLVRLKWWKESLDDIFIKNKDSKNYLLAMIFKYKDQINYQSLSQSIKAFEKDFSEDNKFKTIEELEDYIYSTEGIFYLLGDRPKSNFPIPQFQKNQIQQYLP